MNSAARMAFFRNTNSLWYVVFGGICPPNMSFSMEFFIPWSVVFDGIFDSSMCRFRWNFGMYPMFKYFLFKTIFQRFTPGKQRFVSLLKDFGHKYFLPKHFLAPNAGQKMSFLVAFWWNWYVVLGGIWRNPIRRFRWNFTQN